MIALDDLQKLIREVEAERRLEQQTAGRLAEIAKRLKDQFGISDPDTAKKILKRLQQDEQRAAEEYAAFLKSFKRAMEERRARRTE